MFLLNIVRGQLNSRLLRKGVFLDSGTTFRSTPGGAGSASQWLRRTEARAASAAMGPGTLVIETTFTTDNGRVRLLDIPGVDPLKYQRPSLPSADATKDVGKLEGAWVCTSWRRADVEIG